MQRRLAVSDADKRAKAESKAWQRALSPRWDLGIIPCTAGKHADGVTPLTLYKGSAFSLMMRHARQRCDHILIMSAKYGLLRLDDPVSYYDAYLPELTEQQRQNLRLKLRAQLAETIPQSLYKDWPQRRVLSYLPKAYQDFLHLETQKYRHVFHRPYQGLNMLRLSACLSAEIELYGKSPARR